MKLLCPQCQNPIARDAANIAEVFAYCANCDEAFRIADYTRKSVVAGRLEKPRGPKVKHLRDANSNIGLRPVFHQKAERVEAD